ncbi:hypothetical protein JCM3774_000385 [Rhodotorula dairenensis]
MTVQGDVLAGSSARSLYRALLRTARRMPDDHRTAFVVHRVRSEFEKSRKAAASAARILEGQVYREQLELQAAHLSALARQALLIPVDLRAPRPPASPTVSTGGDAPAPPALARAQLPEGSVRPSSRRGPSRPVRRPLTGRDCETSEGAAPTMSIRPSPKPVPALSDPQPLHPLDRRKLVRAFAARDSQGAVQSTRQNRFMQGPEPSWIRKRQGIPASLIIRHGPRSPAELMSFAAFRAAMSLSPGLTSASLSLPLELLLLIASYVDLPALLALSTVSKPLRTLILGPSCEAFWLLALEDTGLPELEAPLTPVRFVKTGLGAKSSTTSGHDFAPNAGKNTFFFLYMLEQTSLYLVRVFARQTAAFESALETDPLAEMDDFVTFSALPPPLQRELDARADWVRRCWRDGEKLDRWQADARRRKREEAKAAKVKRDAEATRRTFTLE